MYVGMYDYFPSYIKHTCLKTPLFTGIFRGLCRYVGKTMFKIKN